MKITERQGKILNCLIRDYIDLAEPISSEFLEKKHDFGICPASIRLEMQRLTDGGFVFQPHTSAGRVPTDRGYRFFVDELTKKDNKATKAAKGTREIKDIFNAIYEKDIFKFAGLLAKDLAEASANFSVFHLLGQDLFWKEGWGEVIKQPEFKERDFIAEFNDLLEEFEENVDDLELNSQTKVFIGRENPFSKTGDFSIMVSQCRLPKGKKGIVSILGPKRMDYGKNISLVNSLAELLETF